MSIVMFIAVSYPVFPCLQHSFPYLKAHGYASGHVLPSELGIGIKSKEPPRHGKFLLEQAGQEEDFAFDQLLNDHDKLTMTMLHHYD